MEKKLYRSSRQQVVAGVCGGISDYFDVDVTIIRLAWAALFFLGGSGLILYIIAAIIIPKDSGTYSETVVRDENGDETVVREHGEGTGNNSALIIIGIGMIALGALTLVNRLFPYDILRQLRQLRHLGWPAMLILIGAAVMYSAFRKK